MKQRPTQTRLALALLAAMSAQSLHAIDVVKANNTDALNLTTSWEGGVAPTASDVAVWDATVTAANTTVLGANQSWKGIEVTSPGGPVTISAGSTLTLGTGGIDLSAATANLTLASNVLIGPGKQYWTVAAGQNLTISGDLRKQSATGANSFGVVEVATTGTVQLTGTINTVANPPATQSALSLVRIADAQGNPFVTYGKNDWAATNASGTIVAATYADASTSMTAGADNTVVGNIAFTGTVDIASLRFNDAESRTVNISNSGTARTLTARGILVTANSGGGVIGGVSTSAFIRPNRTNVAGSAFNVIQNSASNFEIAANISNGSSGAPTTLVKSGSGNLILSHASNGFTGGTQVFEGTLTVRGNAGAGAIVVAAAGTLGGTGTIAGAVTVNGALRPNLAPVDATARLSLTTGLTLGATSTTTFDIDGANYTGVTLSTAESLTYGGNLVFNFVNGVTVGTYDAFAFTDAAPGTFANVSVSGQGALTPLSGVWSGSYGGFDYVFTEATGDFQVTASAIPEPSSFAALAGLVGLGLAASRRRRATV